MLLIFSPGNEAVGRAHWGGNHTKTYCPQLDCYVGTGFFHHSNPLLVVSMWGWGFTRHEMGGVGELGATEQTSL